MAKKGTAIVTASLDKHVKIYDVSTFQLSHDITYPSAVLSIDISVCNLLYYYFMDCVYHFVKLLYI